MSWAMDNPGLSHAQTSPVQANAAHCTKCSRNQRKLSLNDAHEQTVQRVHQVQEDLLPLCLFAGGGARPWVPYNQTPPHTPPRSTGTLSPAPPGNNQDVGSRSSWDDLRKNWKSAKYSKIKIHAKYSRSAENNTQSWTIRCNNLCQTLSRPPYWQPRPLFCDALECRRSAIHSRRFLPGDC